MTKSKIQNPNESKKIKIKKIGQSIVEYTLFIGLVTMALFSMNTYAKRGLQSVIKLSADNLGAQEGAVAVDEYILEIWQPQADSESGALSSKSVRKHEVNSQTQKVTYTTGSFGENTKSSMSVGSVRRDKKLE